MRTTRRGFLSAGALLPLALRGAAGADAPACPAETSVSPRAATRPPAYLKGYEDLYRANPRAAAIAWFRAAKFGLFVHYGLRSLPVRAGHMNTLSDFRAEEFDAGAIADLALAARMRYVNFTVYHGGGPFLFRTSASSFTSLNSPAKRDLTAELADACRKRGLGLFLYIHISIGRTHKTVFDRNQTILHELLTQYGPVAGMWFDSVLDYFRNPDQHPRFRDAFALVRRLQPQCLVSFKQGALGEEDFLAPEHHPRDPRENPKLPRAVQDKLASLPVEICTTMQLDKPGGKGTGLWFDTPGAYHQSADDVIQLLADARKYKANLLLNTGLRGDGSIHPDDEKTLREVGRRVRDHGWP